MRYTNGQTVEMSHELLTRQLYNIYCDESCHLENDGYKAMVLGGVWCIQYKIPDVSKRIREIKAKHGLAPGFEVKWHKVSASKAGFYLELIDFFFDDDDLHFRGLIIPDKGLLDHEKFNQSHDDFYYKMYFDLLKVILDPQSSYNIYLDIKDTRSQRKVELLQSVLRNSQYDYDKQIVRKVQQIRSHEVELLQVTDLLIGALSYVHRGLTGNAGKLSLVNRIRERSKYSLKNSTLVKESKMNLFVWEPKQ
ncbi:DUF3800 domain-containing protein [Hymenobacter sp. BT523]|uniref:DUF3800 domain-containing protein n=1 Tax=Hymenobacter sp. BT523 TaxID=2795725 RepID=UPI0018EC40FC|nr:DUF3800 domain-containing protein [Hymenobacter sp. BT523]MBJ6107889.1 DUF3800 domain-containing protein [Hymenobacter sp. BT523]